MAHARCSTRRSEPTQPGRGRTATARCVGRRQLIDVWAPSVRRPKYTRIAMARQRLSHSVTQESLTHSVTQSFSHSFSHSVTQSVTHSVRHTHSVNHSVRVFGASAPENRTVSQSLTHSLTQSLSQSLKRSLSLWRIGIGASATLRVGNIGAEQLNIGAVVQRQLNSQSFSHSVPQYRSAGVTHSVHAVSRSLTGARRDAASRRSPDEGGLRRLAASAGGS